MKRNEVLRVLWNAGKFTHLTVKQIRTLPERARRSAEIKIRLHRENRTNGGRVM